MVRKWNPKAGNTFRAFTLIEVLITLSLISLIFLITFGSYIRIINSSTDAIGRSEELYEELRLFWELNRAFVGAKEIFLKDGKEIYLITSGGERFKGLVFRAFISKEDGIYEYEFPYPPRNIRFEVPEEELVFLSPLRGVKFYAYLGGQKLDSYEGLPDALIAEMNGREYVFKIR